MDLVFVLICSSIIGICNPVHLQTVITSYCMVLWKGSTGHL